MAAEPSSDLSGTLGARLAPLLAILGALVALAAPLAHHWLGARELREAGGEAARQAAEVLSREAEERPVLWAYDSIKLVEHLRAYRDRPHVARIEVVDAAGVPIDPAFEHADGALVWASAPLEVHARRIGAVWVGMDVSALRERSLMLLLAFALLGATLALAVYALVMRSARAAETQIDGLVDRLTAVRAEERVRELSQRALAIQEEERRAIARDLHDSAGQALAALRIQAQLVRERRAKPDEVAALADRIGTMADSTLEEVRRAIGRLGPAVIDEIGLRAALDRVIDDLVERAGLAADRRLEGLDDLPAAVETACYRIVQEALTNVTRHAWASAVRVHVRREGDEVRIEVEDDGSGVGEATRAGALGLRGMRERAELLGGRLELGRGEGGGTRVVAVLPVR